MSDDSKDNTDEVLVRFFGLSIAGKGRPAIIVAGAISVTVILATLLTLM